MRRPTHSATGFAPGRGASSNAPPALLRTGLLVAVALLSLVPAAGAQERLVFANGETHE